MASLRSSDPDRAAHIDKLARLKATGWVDPGTKKPPEFAEGEEPVPEPPNLRFFTRKVDRSLLGARSEGGFAIPSELEIVLDQLNIHHPANRDLVRELVMQIDLGRASGHQLARDRSKNGNSSPSR